MRQSALEAGHPNRGERPVHAAMDLCLRDAHVQRTEGHVVEDGGGEELVIGILEDEPDLTPDAPHRRAIDDRAPDAHDPMRRGVDPVEVQHQRRLAGAVRAHQGHLLAATDAQVHAAQRLEAIGIRVVDVVELDPGTIRRLGLRQMDVPMLVRAGALVRVLVRVIVRHRGSQTWAASSKTTSDAARSTPTTHSALVIPRPWRWRSVPSKPRACIAA